MAALLHAPTNAPRHPHVTLKTTPAPFHGVRLFHPPPKVRRHRPQVFHPRPAHDSPPKHSRYVMFMKAVIVGQNLRKPRQIHTQRADRIINAHHIHFHIPMTVALFKIL